MKAGKDARCESKEMGQRTDGGTRRKGSREAQAEGHRRGKRAVREELVTPNFLTWRWEGRRQGRNEGRRERMARGREGRG